MEAKREEKSETIPIAPAFEGEPRFTFSVGLARKSNKKKRGGDFPSPPFTPLFPQEKGK
jgi:hypothetical protein